MKHEQSKSTSIWFDRWCSLSPLRNSLSPRDITRSGCSLSANVADICFVMGFKIGLRSGLIDFQDYSGMMRPFSAGLVWNTIRDATGEVAWAKVKDLAGMAHLSHVFEDILNWLIPLSKSRSVKGVLPKLVLAATSLKLLSFRFKKSKHVDVLMEKWKIPISLVHDAG
ncbi:hypothetical protein Tco_1267402 [Tanacetum coccineum]